MGRMMEAGLLLSSYVTHGAMGADDEFDEVFEQLAPLVPEHCRQTPSHAYRVIVMTAEQHDRLESGQSLVHRPRAFGSWTADERAARMLMRPRCLAAPTGSIVAIVRKSLPPGSCLVDVEAMYRELGWDGGDVEDWTNYVSWEQELVLRQDASLMEIVAGDVVTCYASTDPEALRPMEGERVWIPSIENFSEIEVVEEDQPGDGTWLVDFQGESHTLRWDARHDCWESMEAPTPRL